MKIKREYSIKLKWLILVFILTSCVIGRKQHRIEPLDYAIAPKTSRGHIITECTITLHGFNFTIEYANSARNYAALRTHWREGTDIPLITNENTQQIRDRAALHLSPRGKQPGSPTTLVNSSLQFEMQKREYKKKKWLFIAPDSSYQAQYVAIAEDLKNRLRKRGYIFN